MAAAVQNPQNRAEAVRPIFEAVGGRLHEYYVAVGENTAYIIADIPDHASVAALGAAVHAGGAVDSIKSTPILTAAEAVETLKKASEIGYRPPST
jgi:uncharacterized protein with GYD domain